MLARLFLLFTVVPTVELYLLIQIGKKIGAFETVWLVVIVGFIGAWLAKREGLGVLRSIQADLARGLPPADRVIEGLLVLVGSVLLITPGVISDGVGIFMLLPPTRRWMAPRLRRWLTKRFLEGEGVFLFRMGDISGSVGSPRASPPAEPSAPGAPRFEHPLPEDKS